jgi:hypothetical protein
VLGESIFSAWAAPSGTSFFQSAGNVHTRGHASSVSTLGGEDMKLHTTLSAELNATALLFKKPFHLHRVFHNACTNELCEFMSADRGVFSIYCRATVLLQRVFLLLHSSCEESAYLMHLRPHAQQ